MIQTNCYQNIKDFMLTQPNGFVFATADCKDFGSPSAVRKALSRLTQEGYCRRVLPGIFDRPAYSELFAEYEGPDVYSVAAALARNYNWKIVPAPIIAQNLLGLSTQVPAVVAYTSTGPARTYTIDGITLSFKSSRSEYLYRMNYKSALVVNALQGLKQFDFTKLNFMSVTKKLAPAERDGLLADKQYAPVWMHPYIDQICRIH